MKVGVIGGGFKPPHKGHYELAKQALTQVPDLDKKTTAQRSLRVS